MTVTPGFVYRDGEDEESFPQVTVPVIAKPNSDGQTKPRVATEEALRVTNKEPVKTVWAWPSGRPIYDRLPAVAGAYKQDYRAVYGRDQQDQAYVFLKPPFQSGLGPGSLEPTKQLNDFSVLQFQNGSITWSAGTLDVEPFQIDTSILNGGLGLQDGAYQAGYLLSATDPAPPDYVMVGVENYLLGTAQVAYAANREFTNHPASAALTGPDLPGSWWPFEFSVAGDYVNGSWYVLDLIGEPKGESVVLQGDPEQPVTAYGALYYSDDAIVWYKQGQQLPTDNSYTFSLNGGGHRYTKFFFWGRNAANNQPLKANIQTIRYTGDIGTPNYTSVTPSPFAEAYIDDLYEEIEQEHILICTFNVSGGVIQGLQDQRQFIYREYQPVADWLTTFQDTQLKCLFDDVVNYAPKFLAPPTSSYSYYEDLDDSLCFGRGFLNLGDIEDQVAIDFPTKVELIPIDATRVVFQGDILTDPTPGQDIQVDLTPVEDLSTDGSTVLYEDGIQPFEIWGLADPTTPGSAANKRYVDFQLNLSWSIDNGIY